MMDPARLAILQTRLAAADVAYDAMMNSRVVTEVTIDGQNTKFRTMLPDDLLAYITQLKAEIAGPRQNGAIGLYF